MKESNYNEFPILNEYTFLNHAAIAPLPKRSAEAGSHFLNEACFEANNKIEQWFLMKEKVKKRLASLLGCHSDEIAFIKNTSEGLHLVANSLDWQQGDNVILFSHEFPANVYPWTNLKKLGVDVRFVPEKNGQFFLDDVKDLMDEKTRLLAVSFVEYTTGFKNDLHALGQLCQEYNVLFVVDAVQGLGAVPINVKDCQIDFLSSGGLKWLMSQSGIGCFYANLSSIEKLVNYNYGYASVIDRNDYDRYYQPPSQNAERFEEGLFNLAGMYILGASLSLILETGINEIYNKISVLTDYLIDQLKNKGYHLLTPIEKKHRSGIISFNSNKHNSKDLFKLLHDNKIVVSELRNCIRVSPHFYNTKDHIDKLIELLP